MTIRRKVVVSGRVQGVFFRDSCRERAQQDNVVGWVANASDGTVEACFEGDADAVERLIAWCRTGPSGAEVRSLEVQEQEPQGGEGFSVR